MQAIFHLSLAIYVSKVVTIETRGDQKMQKNTTVRSDFLGIVNSIVRSIKGFGEKRPVSLEKPIDSN